MAQESLPTAQGVGSVVYGVALPMTDMLHDLAVGYRKEQVKNLPRGTIVRFQGDWGVLIKERWLDRWEGEPIQLSPTDVVEVLSKKAVT